ncbi:hypothetical protein P8452_12295 [Trifolium repens]|nr:hypothetical protein P8452_12295 [Trifolium repens]
MSIIKPRVKGDVLLRRDSSSNPHKYQQLTNEMSNLYEANGNPSLWDLFVEVIAIKELIDFKQREVITN